VFAYLPDKAMESSQFMHKAIHEYVDRYWSK